MNRQIAAAFCTAGAIGAIWVIEYAAAFLHALTHDLGRQLLGHTDDGEDQ